MNKKKRMFTISGVGSKPRKKAFTLAEVLIVIGVIGVVAAITIPTLIPLIKDKVDSNRKEVIEDRLIQGMNQLNTLDDGFNASQYSSTGTEGFVKALSAHYKMSQICGANDLRSCFPYTSLTYTKKDGTEATKNWADLKTPEDFGLKSDEYYAPAGFISAQGTPFAMLLKKDCIMDTGTGMRTIPTGCVQYMYDNNGSNIPNKISSDLQKSEGIAIGVTMPDGTLQNPIGEYKTYLILGKNYKGGDGTTSGLNTCDDSSDKVWDTRGSENEYCSDNKWAAAKKACADEGFVLANKSQLIELYCRYINSGSYIICYGDGPCSSPVYNCSVGRDNTFATKANEKADPVNGFWADANSSSGSQAPDLRFGFGLLSVNDSVNSTYSAICLGK